MQKIISIQKIQKQFLKTKMKYIKNEIMISYKNIILMIKKSYRKIKMHKIKFP